MGRPSDWTESRTKKLITARAIGLRPRESLEVVSYLTRGGIKVEKGPERRAQMILNELCVEDGGRINGNNSWVKEASLEVVKSRAALLNRLGKQAGKKSPDIPHNPPIGDFFDNPSSSSGPSVTSDGIDIGGQNSLGLCTSTHSGGGVQVSIDCNPISGLYDGDDSILSLEPNLLWETETATSTKSGLLAARSISRHPGLYKVLKAYKRTSSCIVDVASIFSRLSLAGPGRRHEIQRLAFESVLSRGISMPNVEINLQNLRKSQEKEDIKAGRILIQHCCQLRLNCLHRSLNEHAMNNQNSYIDELDRVNERDPLGNNSLFFAARVGMPFETLSPLIDTIQDINATNNKGQTFLFVLDPISIKSGNGMSEIGKILVLKSKLLSRGYRFYQTDHEGRTFLSYMCLKPSFTTAWLIAFNRHFPVGCSELALLSAQRDAFGAFLVDYLGDLFRQQPILVNDRQAIEEAIEDQEICNFRDLGITGPENSKKARLLKVEGSFMRSNKQDIDSVNKVMFPEFPSTSITNWPDRDPRRPNLWHDILYNPNQYGVDGMTPFLRGLLRRLQRNDQFDLTPYDKQCINLNAQSRQGRTALHLSTRFNRPDVLRQLLQASSQIIQVNHSDRYEFRAFDYATDNLNESRRESGTARQFADALKCILDLVDRGAWVPDLPTTATRVVTADDGREILVPETEPMTQAVLDAEFGF